MKVFSGVNKRPMFKKELAVNVAVLIIFTLIIMIGVAAASSGGGEDGPKGWKATDTYRIINFSVLVIALFFLLRKPVSEALNGRVAGIQQQLDELETKNRQAEKTLAEYKDKLSLLDQESEKLLSEYVRQGNEAKARILQEAETAAAKLEEQARRNIAHEFEQAKLKLQEDIIEKALIKAEETIQSRVTGDDQNRLVDEYLEKVVAL